MNITRYAVKNENDQFVSFNENEDTIHYNTKFNRYTYHARTAAEAEQLVYAYVLKNHKIIKLDISVSEM